MLINDRGVMARAQEELEGVKAKVAAIQVTPAPSDWMPGFLVAVLDANYRPIPKEGFLVAVLDANFLFGDGTSDRVPLLCVESIEQFD